MLTQESSKNGNKHKASRQLWTEKGFGFLIAHGTSSFR